MIWIALLGVTSGLMIGCIGIGGVILVPALVYLARIPIQIGRQTDAAQQSTRQAKSIPLVAAMKACSRRSSLTVDAALAFL